LSEFQRFYNIVDVVTRNENSFRAWYEGDSPEAEQVPYFSVLTPFEKLLLVRHFREDRTLAAALLFVKETIGGAYVEVPPYNLQKIVEREVGSGRHPILFLLSQGSDPGSHVEHLARRERKQLHQISLGQGQEPNAIAALKQSAAKGDWVMFQNCHLALTFLHHLEKWVVADSSDISEMAPQAARASTAATGAAPAPTDHHEFRIFLTSDPFSEFPAQLLMRCLPLTDEPPSGSAATMRKALSWVQQDTWDMFARTDWRCCIHALCFYHTVLLERRKYGVHGWTAPYQFSEGDFLSSTVFLQNHFSSLGEDAKKAPVAWEAVQFMIGDIHYGGRVTLRHDRILLQTITEKLFNASVTQPSALLSPSMGRFPVLPEISDVNVWRQKALSDFALNEPPQLCGLTSNAELAHRTRIANTVLTTLLKIQPQSAGVEEDDSESFNAAQQRETAITGILTTAMEKLPTPWSDQQIQEWCVALDPLKPLTIFFRLEALRLRTVIEFLVERMQRLSQGIQGAVTLTKQLSDFADTLFLGQVPAELAAISWPSQSFSTWLINLQRRYDQIQENLMKGDKPCNDVSCFFNPQGFLNSVRQAVCRRHAAEGWSLGKTEVKLHVTKLAHADVEHAPEEGAFVSGFVLDGAGWDTQRSRLRTPQSKELYREMPVVIVTAQLIASAPSAKTQQALDLAEAGATSSMISQAAFRMHRAQREADAPVKRARVPVYANSSRGDANFLCEVDLAHEEQDGAVWVLRGVALLCSPE
jgi:dynein heavy chain